MTLKSSSWTLMACVRFFGQHLKYQKGVIWLGNQSGLFKTPHIMKIIFKKNEKQLL